VADIIDLQARRTAGSMVQTTTPAKDMSAAARDALTVLAAASERGNSRPGRGRRLVPCDPGGTGR
jgi:hypothetical protein